MNIIRLNKVTGVLEVLKNLKEIQEEMVFVLQENIHLYKFIENLSLNGVNLNRLKVVNEISFNFKVLLKDKYNGEILAEAESLSEILEFLNVSEIQRYVIILLTDENGRHFVSDVMQQFVYLNLHIDVMLEKEEKEKNTVNSFKKYFNRIKTSLKAARKGIFDTEINEQLQAGKNELINTINEIESILLEAERRELIVAVMATKKSGKSVIVNSFLGNEYAPASFELATPNSIIYKSGIENNLILDYKSQRMEFDNPDSIRHYVEDVYKQAQAHIDGEELVEDMFIQYCSGKQKLENFTIIDTPGPDLAGSNHREIAYKWIEAADVVVFAIDYCKCLTDAEENYLRDIKTLFDKHDKSHSLIVVVNKIDLMYASGEKNSVVRFLDSLRFKLSELGYKDFVVFAVSALQYFSAIKVPMLNGCDHLYECASEELAVELKKCKSRYYGKKEMAVIRTLEDYIRDLEDYIGISDTSLEKIMENSGMLRVINYTNYITTQKANVEVFKAVMRKIDDRYASIKNYLFTYQFNNLKERKTVKEKEREGLLRYMNNAYEIIDNESAKIKEVLDFSGLINEIQRELAASEQESLRMINSVIQNELRVIRKSLRFNGDEVVKTVLEDNKADISSKLQTNFHKFLLDRFNEKAGYCQRKVNEVFDKKQECLSGIDKNIQENITLIKEHLKTNFQAGNIKITLPKLELAFSRRNFDFNKVDSKVIIEIQDILKKSLHQKHGVVGRLMQFATLNAVDKRFGKYEIDFESINEMLYSLSKDIKDEVASALRENNEKILKYVITFLNEELQPKIIDEFKSVINNYRSLIKQVEDAFDTSEADLENHIKLIEEKINFLKESEGTLQLFFDVWESVRQGGSYSANREGELAVL